MTMLFSGGALSSFGHTPRGLQIRAPDPIWPLIEDRPDGAEYRLQVALNRKAALGHQQQHAPLRQMCRGTARQLLEDPLRLALPFMVRRITDDQVVALIPQLPEPIRQDPIGSGYVRLDRLQGYGVNVQKIHGDGGLPCRDPRTQEPRSTGEIENSLPRQATESYP